MTDDMSSVVEDVHSEKIITMTTMHAQNLTDPSPLWHIK